MLSRGYDIIFRIKLLVPENKIFVLFSFTIISTLMIFYLSKIHPNQCNSNSYHVKLTVKNCHLLVIVFANYINLISQFLVSLNQQFCFAELVLVRLFGRSGFKNMWKYRPMSNLIAIADTQDISSWNKPMNGRIKSFRLYLPNRYDMHYQYLNTKKYRICLHATNYCALKTRQTG